MKKQNRKNIADTITELSALFPQNTAGRDMITRIPIFQKDAKVKDVRHYIFVHAKYYETINYIYVVNNNSQILGVVSIRELFQAKINDQLHKIMVQNIVAVNPMDTVARVALLALQNNLKMVPIVDHKNRLVGAFSSNQILDILNKEFSNDLLRLSGIRVPRKHFPFNSWKIVFSRLPWMIIGMLGGLVTGTIIGAFRSSMETIILLAVFIPVIMSSGATSANQSAMIFLRNLIHGDVKHWVHYILDEIKIASLLALICGILLLAILSVFPGDIILAAAVSTSFFVTVIFAAIIGVVIPMVLNKLKMDPSIGAGPFLTIIKDIVAMTIYFTISTLFLTYLR